MARSASRLPCLRAFAVATVGLVLLAPAGAAESELGLDGLDGEAVKAATWRVQTDARSGGASKASVRRVNDRGTKAYRWDYSLKGTAKAAYPYCSLWVDGLPQSDLSAWDGVIIKAKGSRPGLPLAFSIGVIDSKLGVWKGLGYSFSVTNEYSIYKLPFTRFKTMPWWLGEHPDNSGQLDLDRATGLALEADGPSGDSGSVFVAELSLYKGEGRGSLAGEIAGPTHETVRLDAAREEAPAAAKTEAARIAVRPDQPFEAPYTGNKGRINPLIWGSNWGQWMCSFPDTEKAKALNLRLIRVGGNNMSRYNWRNSLYTDSGSTKPLRQPSLEEFVAFCRSVGAEPLIQVNAFGWAPSDKPGNPMEKCMTEKDAADLVTYLNGAKALGVTYFEIDNEFEIWSMTHSDLQKSAVSAKEYIDTFIKYAVAMKAAQAAISKPEDIKILGPANCSAWNGWKTEAKGDPLGGFDALPPCFLKACADYEKATGLRVLDVYSFHYYASFRPDYRNAARFIPEGLPAMLESTRVWWNPAYANRYDQSLPRGRAWQLIPMYRKWIADIYPGTELAVTEFNLDAASKIYYAPGLREIWQAEAYGIMAKYGVDFALQFALNSNDLPMSLMGLSDGLTPSYWMLQMYASDFSGTVVEARSDKPETLNVYACVQDSGDLVIMVVNKDTKKDWTASIEVEGRGLPAFARSFPRLSLTSVKIPRSGAEALIRSYGLAQIVPGP